MMTIDEFHERIAGMARMGIDRYCGYLRHETREDKYLREEYLAIQAVIRHKGYPGHATIELGDEREVWDARVGGTDLFEAVQALPTEEHVIRKAVAGGRRSSSCRSATPGRASRPRGPSPARWSAP
jgi:hypothetical protein